MAKPWIPRPHRGFRQVDDRVLMLDSRVDQMLSTVAEPDSIADPAAQDVDLAAPWLEVEGR